MDERVGLIRKHSSEICACAEAPLDNLFWVKRAKEKHAWRLLAFCFEWRDYIAGEHNGVAYRSRLPVGMDGTCNGFQHFAALLRDPELARWTNLAPSLRPADLYSVVADWVCEAIRSDHVNPREAPRKDENIRLVDRKLAKSVVMIIPYGASRRGIYHKVRDCVFASELNRSWTQQFGPAEARERTQCAATYLTAHFTQVMREKLPRPWLQACCKQVVARGIPMIWISPVGLPILQAHSRCGRARFTRRRSASFGLKALCRKPPTKLRGAIRLRRHRRISFMVWMLRTCL